MDLNFSQRLVSDLQWRSGLKYSYNNSKVTSLKTRYTTAGAMVWQDFVEGYAPKSVFSYIYNGMNEDGEMEVSAAATGESYGVYSSFIGNPGKEILKYEGTYLPKSILSWSNTFTWRGLTLRAMITGKFGHKFRRSTFSYSDTFSTKNYHKDLAQILAGNAAALGLPDLSSEYNSRYYSLGNVVPDLNSLVEDASHIRLREIYLGYDLTKRACNALRVGGIRIYSQIRNVGLIWAANDKGIDPDYISGSVVKPEASFTFGLNVNF